MTRKRRPSFAARLPGWQEVAIYAAFGALFATGLVWLWLEHFVRVTGEFGPQHHPAQTWLLKGHGIAAYAFAITAGALIPVHIRLGWRGKRNRRSGLTLVVLALALALTGLGLYYIAGDDARGVASIAHWTIGIGCGLALAIHAWRGRQTVAVKRVRKPAAAPQSAEPRLRLVKGGEG